MAKERGLFLKTIHSITPTRTAKQSRERKILLGLVEYYIKHGKPVGSNALKEAGFGDLSSATIRNYFAVLEEEGYLVQQHSSSGRIPTNAAYRFYANEYKDADAAVSASPVTENILQELRTTETREIAAYLQYAAEKLNRITQTAVFLSAPRFDQDFISAIKLVPIDHVRCLCVLITDFGVIKTEVLPTERKLTAFAVKRIEDYFHWRLTGNDKPEHLDEEEVTLSQQLYNELMVRHIVSYSNFSDEEVYRTGFSQLLAYPEFHNTAALSTSLALFENTHSMRLLLKQCSILNDLTFWIGDDLVSFTEKTPNCAILAIPYYINQQAVGSIGLLGPVSLPYRELFATLRTFSVYVSEALTRAIYKFKISFRQPHHGSTYLPIKEKHMIGQSRLMLLEDKR